jgi:hypothetical protein
MINESKSHKFKRLAKSRGELVIKYLQLFGNLSNKNNYEYTDEEVRKVFYIIEEELKNAKSRFNKKKKREISF